MTRFSPVSLLDGIAYELEPWEQARRERLARYARERDHLAGIDVYDGDWDGASGSPCETDTVRPQQAPDESQATRFQDEFDQRPPPQWEDSQWDQRPHSGASVPQTHADPDIDQSIAEDDRHSLIL